MLPIDLRPDITTKVFSSDFYVEFTVITETDKYFMVFDTDGRYREMLDFMVDTYSIDPDSIVEVRNCYVHRYN